MDHIVALLVSSLTRYWVAGNPVCVCSECETVGWSAPKLMTSQDKW